MTMKKTVVGDVKETFAKTTLFKGRELSPDEEKVKQFQEITFNLSKFDDENRTFQAIASTPVVDRQGDSVLQEGWFLDNFLMNPVVPWAHDYSQPPVARATEIGINAQGNLQFTYQAPPEGLYEFADTIWNLYRNGFMFAFSVGFIPMDYEGDWREGYTFTEAELLEISAVVVPANPQAVGLSFKGGYISERQAKTLRSKMAQSLKQLEETMAKAQPKKEETTEVVEPKDEPAVKDEAVEKGQLADALENDADWMDKYNKFESVDDIWWTFCDVWFSATTTLDDWTDLLKELAQLLMGVANGTYTPPSDNDGDDYDDDEWIFLGKSLKKGVDKNKVKEFLAVAAQKIAEDTTKGLTNSEKVKDNSIMTESQEAALKALQAKVESEAEANAEFRKSVLDMLSKKGEEPAEVVSDEDKTKEDNKPEAVPVKPAPEAPVVVEEKPVETQTEEVSNKDDDKESEAKEGEVKSDEDSEDGADQKEKEVLIDPDNLTPEQQEEFIKIFNEELEKEETDKK